MSLTMLLAAVLPSFVEAAMAQRAAPWMEICSAAGHGMAAMARGAATGHAQRADGGKGKSPASSSSMNCPCCVLHHGAPSLPPSASAWQPPAALRFERPTLFLQAPRPLFVWAPARARAPPSMA